MCVSPPEPRENSVVESESSRHPAPGIQQLATQVNTVLDNGRPTRHASDAGVHREKPATHPPPGVETSRRKDHIEFSVCLHVLEISGIEQYVRDMSPLELRAAIGVNGTFVFVGSS